MKRYKILHVITSLQVGGAEMLLLSLAEHLREHGFDSEVLGLGSEDNLRPKFEAIGVPVHTLGMMPSRAPGLAAFRNLLGAARSSRPDILQGWMSHGNIAALLARTFALRGVPLAWSIHQTLGRFHTQPRSTRMAIRAMAMTSRCPEAIVFVSRTSRSEHEAFGFSDRQTLHIPNGVDTRKFIPGTDARGRARELLGIPVEATVIGHVARFHPAKDQVTLLEALKLVLRERPDTHAVLVGRELLPGNPAISIYADAPQFEGRLHLLGPRADVRELLPGFDVFCLSSAFGEACSVAMLEAMSSGVRCVVTDVADAAWMLDGTGGLVPVKDPEAMAKDLLRVLGMDPLKSREDAARSRQRVVEVFDLETMAKSYAQMYRRIIHREQ